MNLKLSAFFGVSMIGFMSCKQPELQQFTDMSESSNISFSNNITETAEQNIFSYEYMYNGAGVAVGDVNNDGLPDIFFTANQLPDQLYLNKGNLKFEDITATANVAGKPGWKTGVSMADVNGDGLLDIYICYSGNGDAASRSNQLFINKGIENGMPVFEDQAKQYGLDAPGTNSNQAVFFDYDHDGDLDMFLLDHAVIFYSPVVNTYKLRHKRHPWYSNYLFRNDGGHFTDVSAIAGIAGGGNNFGLGVVAADVNNDGWQDLYMTNDYEEQDFLLLNNQDGTFSEVTKQSLKHISKYGMGCDVADYNNDGLNDIMVPDMWPEDNYRQKVLRGPDEYDKYNLLIDSGYMHQNMRNTLQLNRGIDAKGLPAFSEIGQLAGVSNTDWSWSSLLADFDNDGNKDLYITNGFWRDYSNMDFQTFEVADFMNKNGNNAPLYKLVDKIPQTKLSNYAFRNKADLSFENVTTNWGLHTSNVSNGVAYADLDNDGDLDLVVNNMGEKASVYRNNNISQNNYLNIQLKGAKANTNAVGSSISITYNNGKQQLAEQQPVRGYLSCMQPLVHFGLGKDSIIATLTVRWPLGNYTVLKNVKANQAITINEAVATKDSLVVKPVEAPVFTDVSKQAGISFYQPENNYIDYKTESLLPWQLSKQGPKMCTSDVNGDGLNDVFIGAPKGGKACLYLQQTDGHFIKASSQPWAVSDNNCDDVQAVFFDADGDNDMDLYIASGGNEMPDIPAYKDRLFTNNGKGNFTGIKNALPIMNASKSCVATGDFNGDGKPDIFVGGRVVPGKYGIAPQSFLLQNETQNGIVKFKDVTALVAPSLQHIGMVTAAVWTDINKDNLPDLVIAGEWMPVTIFINNKNKLADKTTEYGLQNSNGLWTCIVPMDIDADGDEDYLLGNLAPNTAFNAAEKQPMTLYVNDFFRTNKMQSVLCYYIDGKSYPYASKNEITEDMPALKKKFLYYKDYASAGISNIFSPEQMQGTIELKVNQLKNCWLENAGNGKLVLHELPIAAQFSAIQGAVMTSAKIDGTKQIFAAGNYYPFRVQLGRADAGKGMLLQWDKAKRKMVALQNTGIHADGDVRDVISVQTARHEQLIIISKNSDSVQVIKR
ncbi:VCBS repeat-containing protein [soil metagenome]